MMDYIDYNQIDYTELSKEIIRVLRSSMAKSDLSKKLGYNYNACYRWEAGSKKIYWKDFVNICKITNTNLNSAIQVLFPKNLNVLKGRKILEELQGAYSEEEYSKLLGMKLAKLRRWKQNSDLIALDIILKSMAKSQVSLFPFLEKIIDVSKIKLLENTYKIFCNDRKIEVKFPIVSALNAALQLADYRKLDKHSDSFFENKFNFPLKMIKDTVREMRRINAVKVQDGLLKTTGSSLINNSGITYKETIHSSIFWQKYIQGYLKSLEKAPDNVSTLFYGVYASSPEKDKKIKKLSDEYIKKIISVLEETSDKDLKSVRCFQIFSSPLSK